MSEQIPEEAWKLLEEADALLAMCNIIQKRKDGDYAERRLTPEFRRHLRIVKEKSTFKDRPMEEAVQDDGFLTLAVTSYLGKKGFSFEFFWNTFASIVPYLKGFFQILLTESEKEVR